MFSSALKRNGFTACGCDVVERLNKLDLVLKLENVRNSAYDVGTLLLHQQSG